MVDPVIAEQMPGLLATLRSTAIELHRKGINNIADMCLDAAVMIEHLAEELEL